MKTNSKSTRQQGFFDFGIALLILAFSGGMVYTTNDKKPEAPQQMTESEQTVVAKNQGSL